MTTRRVGLWMIGASGGVGSTAALGLAALARDLTDRTALVTALPMFDRLDLDEPAAFVVGGHEIRAAGFPDTVHELQRRSNVFEHALVQHCLPDLHGWAGNVRPGTLMNVGPAIAALADRPDLPRDETPRGALKRLQADLVQFKKSNHLDQVVVLYVASTEPPFPPHEAHETLDRLDAALDHTPDVLPASSLYAYAALDLGFPFVNFTPSPGASLPALEELAARRKTVIAGKDGKTGETLMKSVLAPMFALRNLRVLSWVGHNIFGNRDGLILDDPRNKASKIKSKDQLVHSILGYQSQTHVSIEYIESLDDWKTAWDHIHFRGFLNVKMVLQFIWQGCDSILAAPLALDLARLTLVSQRRGEVGVLKHLACFFKSPAHVAEHDFSRQFTMLGEYVEKATRS